MGSNGEVKINHSAFDRAINTLGSNAEGLNNAIQALKKQTTALSGDWIGQAGNSFRSVFQTMQDTLTLQVQDLQTIGQNLHSTDETFKQLDCQISNEFQKEG